MSFNSEYQELRKKRLKKNKEELEKGNDIAPLNFSMSDIAPVYEYNAMKEDIAPVTKTETQTEEKSGLFDGYFQKGAFEDGYQFGDIAKTLIATDADIATSLPAKVLDWGENALDAGASGIAKLAGKLGKEDTRDKLIDFVEKDLYDGKDVARKILNSKFARGRGGLGALNAIISLDNMLNSEKVVNEDGKEVKVLQDHSVLDDKADSLIASAGETLVKMGISAATGVPAITDAITGVTVFGAKTENSLREGANIDQATGSALISAGAEIIGERLGGISFGGKTLSDGLSRLLSEKVSNVALRTVLNGAADIGFESLEEVFTEFVDKLGTKLYKEEKLGEILFSDEALQDYADAALAGGLLGGSFSGVNAIKSSVDGTDYKTGLTDNENKVVNKEVENRIAEKEANGEKVTAKVKNEIYNEVMEDLTKGYISTDTIESVLDEEGYDSYKNLRDSETRLNEKVESLTEEIDTLLDKENPTIRDNERLAEARKELETAKSDLEKIGGYINDHVALTRHNMNEVLKGERKGKGSYLAESYNEIDRLSQRYVADFSKYEGTKHADAARKTIENAMKRGANNTNRVHDVVEMGAKLSSDTGIVFDWAGNEDIKKDFIKQQKAEIEKLEAMTELSEEDATKLAELKEMLQKVESGETTVNGNITDNGVVINLDSKKALNRIVGHEIAHSLEKSAAYTELKNALFAYAKDKGFDVDAEIEAKTKTYKGVKKAQPEAELVADLVGDYIFNEYDFVLNLATNNRSVFQKVYDEVKYLYKLATAGSKEARDLARAKRNFERAYRESAAAENNFANGNTAKYSLNEFSDGQRFVIVDTDQSLFDGLSSKEQTDLATKIIKNRYQGKVIGIDNKVFVNGKTADEFTHPAKHLDSNTYEAKMRASTELDNLMDAGFGFRNAEDGEYGHTHADVTGGFDYFDVIFKVGSEYYQGTINIKNIARGKLLKDITKIKNITSDMTSRYGENPSYAFLRDVSMEIIPQNSEKSSGFSKFSLEADNSYLDAAKRGDVESAQKMVDKAAHANGYTVKAYHGTSRADRVGNVFRPDRSTSGPMAFFTDNKDIADNYARNKADTSLAYDTEYDSYYTQFRVNRNGKNVSIPELWNYLSFSERNSIKEKAKHIRFDDDYENILVDETAEHGNGAWDAYTLNMHRGNALEALVDTWLESGDLYNREADFMQVLELVGIKDVEYRNPDARYEKTYDAWLKIQKPFDTDNVDRSFYDGLSEWIDNNDMSVYEKESSNADMWDKNNQTPESWLEKLSHDIENGTTHAWTVIPDFVTDYLKQQGYDGIKDKGGKGGGASHTVWIPFSSEQVKSAEPITYDDSGNVIPLSERFDSSKTDIRYSISEEGEQLAPLGRREMLGSDFRVRGDNVLAPVQEGVARNATTTQRTVSEMEQVAPRADLPISDVDYAPVVDERSRLEARVASLQEEMDSLLAEARELGDRFFLKEITEEEHETRVFGEIKPRYNELADERLGIEKQLKALEETEAAKQGERLDSLTDEDAPPEVEAPYYGDNEAVTPDDPLYDRDIKTVGNRKVKAYMYENPEFKPFFQKAANELLGDLRNTTKGERWYNEVDGSSHGLWGGTQRHTTADIAYLLDVCHYTYQQIEDGLNAIIEDNGKENNAVSKKIEILLSDRLMNGYEDIDGYQLPPDQDYINFLNEKQIRENTEEERQKFFEAADEYAPIEEGAEPTIEAPLPQVEAEAVAQPTVEAPLPDVSNAGKNVAQGKKPMQQEKRRVAQVLTEEPQKPKKKSRLLSMARTHLLDKHSVFEDLALKTKNRELMGKANYMLSSESRAQWFIGHGRGRVKALTDIKNEVESSGKLKDFNDYIYHVHNIDRMSLESDEHKAQRMAVRRQFKGLGDKQIEGIAKTWITKDTTAEEEAKIRAAREYVELSKNKDKPVFDYSVTADISREEVKKYEAMNPEFKAWAQDVYDYNKYLRKMLVDGNVISQETADLWEKIYPHFVPIRRDGQDGSAVNVPLDSRKTGVNAPIKRATGGNADILPLFDTMALRTEQTFKAVAKNQFGLELLHTLDSAIEADEANGSAASVDDVLEGMETQDELLQKGKDGMNPTFTVFENGKRVTFEITEDMYDALKPTSEALSLTIKPLNVANNIRRGLITEYNPVFLATNAIKDSQDILINSQHPAKTYAKIPQAYWELAKKGKWYTEYMAAGGEQNTFFDGESKTFKKEDEGFKKLIGMPLRAISAANNFMERAPRLAEYIASRESGASVETAMLDAARVTTNFAAGGDVTKALNRNGFTFLNASVQGAMQQVRNIREAKQNGFKGWAQLAAKTMIAGIPALLLNGILWDDDEDYEELSDYVKDNYYIVAKYGDGQFVRIPKGRMVAVIQDAFEQIGNVATGKEADWGNLWDLAKTNIAPTNPADNNIIAPIKQVLKNETWYGEDLVPTRLQDLPAEEQFDESTDLLSKWLGDVTNTSPMKWNYLLDQYSGGVGDVILPMMTPEAESGNDSFVGNMLAPWKDKFTTDSVMNNQNVSDFYDKVDELAKNANGSRATDEDILMSKYMNSVSSELGELYGLKREIQNSDLPDNRKYEKVRDIQDEINALARESLDSYANVQIDGNYATVGDLHYQLKSGKWQKLSDDQYDKQIDVTEDLGISASDYWSNKSEYDFAHENPERYAVARSVGGYDSYKTYMSSLYDIKADKDESGKSIRGSRKEKVIAWINEQEDLDYGEAIILFKSEYPADDTYNMDIIDYLNGRNDISYDDMETILKELGFTVDSKGNITWD